MGISQSIKDLSDIIRRIPIEGERKLSSFQTLDILREEDIILVVQSVIIEEKTMMHT